ncbi:MAG: 2,3-bisphosphoglycerate-independent phosphoglycerate mutase [Oscillospiraceae bacterium]|jgi:2,3-bisphosphoglycerate-independent phosphoglycerate mutase|nr:2,3-bisphosphoglycerate-independent phosphoglycerate mutase [Oscillospiraceae bacterium]
MKYILVIGDGMADNPVPELGGQTPLQFAKIPTADSLAAEGLLGTVKTCPKGLPPGSDTGILSIFGADPRECYTGRSPLEAAASGVTLEPDEVSYRCNMVTLSEEPAPFAERLILSHSGGSIDGESSAELVNFLFSDPEFKLLAAKAGLRVYPAQSFRHIAVQRGANLTGLKLFPPHDYLGSKLGEILPNGSPNAEVLKELMEKSFRVLSNHPINEARRENGLLPANAVWFWAEGSSVKLEPFYEKFGKKGAVISAVPLCHGIAKLSELDVIEVEGATGELDTDYEGKTAAALTALASGYDFAAIHVEAPDECTHCGDTKGKIQAIEWLDSRVLSPLTKALDAAGFDYRLLYLPDHKTLTSTRGHDGSPVPFLIYDSRKNSGAGLPFTEEGGLKGPYIDAGLKLMPLLFEQPEPQNIKPY